MEVVLVMAMFIVTALALNFIANDRTKLSGACNIVNLCLIVAVAYQFKLVNTIIIVLVILTIAVIGIMVLMQKRKKDKQAKSLDGRVIENKED